MAAPADSRSKTADKTADKTATVANPTVRGGTRGRPFQPGHDPRRGGGKKGRSGPVPSALRARMRGSLAERITIAEDVADDTDAAPGDRMRALEFLAKHGLQADEPEPGDEGTTTEHVVRVVREYVTRTVVSE